MDIKNDIQDILSGFMMKDAGTLDVLRNNAKTIGGVIGVEHALEK